MLRPRPGPASKPRRPGAPPHLAAGIAPTCHGPNSAEGVGVTGSGGPGGEPPSIRSICITKHQGSLPATPVLQQGSIVHGILDVLADVSSLKDTQLGEAIVRYSSTKGESNENRSTSPYKPLTGEMRESERESAITHGVLFL